MAVKGSKAAQLDNIDMAVSSDPETVLREALQNVDAFGVQGASPIIEKEVPVCPAAILCKPCKASQHNYRCCICVCWHQDFCSNVIAIKLTWA